MYSNLVSVIIPVYNAEKHILECINSVTSQTYRNLEIIIVNDGSTDNTLEVIKTIRDERIILINQENRGCSSAKNTGINRAQGNYIQYLDADDALSPDKIEKQLIKLENTQNNIAVCKTLFFKETITRPCGEIDTELIRKEGTGLLFLLRLMGSEGVPAMVQPNAYLIPKGIVDQIGNWNVYISPSPDEDGEYFTRALLAAEQVYFTEGINFYRKVPNQKSLSQVHSYQRALNLLKTVDLKFKHIFKVERSMETERLFQLNISQVAYQYGTNYPDIIVESKNILNGNKFKSLKITQPWKFKVIALIIGFENLISLKRFLNQILSNRC